jgi:hypothetical protein
VALGHPGAVVCHVGLGCGGWGAGIPNAITSLCERLHGRVIMTITVPKTKLPKNPDNDAVILFLLYCVNNLYFKFKKVFERYCKNFLFLSI